MCVYLFPCGIWGHFISSIIVPVPLRYPKSKAVDLQANNGQNNPMRQVCALCLRCLRLFICPSVCVCLSFCLFICPSVWSDSLSVCPSVCVCLSVCLSVSQSVFICLSIGLCLSVCLSVSLCVHLSVCPSVCVCVCVCVYVCFCMYICLRLCLWMRRGCVYVYKYNTPLS